MQTIQKKHSRRRAQRGMTLIEIMVVVTILGLIAAAVGVAVIPKLGEARVERAYVDFKAIESALDTYKIRKGSYPDTQTGFQALVPNDLKEVPLDPWGNPYEYMLESGKPVILTRGGDGQPGGEGEDSDLSNKSPRKRE